MRDYTLNYLFLQLKNNFLFSFKSCQVVKTSSSIRGLKTSLPRDRWSGHHSIKDFTIKFFDHLTILEVIQVINK